MGVLDARVIVEAGEEKMEAVFRERPPIHRYPARWRSGRGGWRRWSWRSTAGMRAVWGDAEDGDHLLRRMKALPGYGEQKAQIFVAILGKRFGLELSGWREAAGKYGDDEPRSVADIDSPEAVQKVRASSRRPRPLPRAYRRDRDRRALPGGGGVRPGRRRAPPRVRAAVPRRAGLRALRRAAVPRRPARLRPLRALPRRRGARRAPRLPHFAEVAQGRIWPLLESREVFVGDVL